jgi:hypothetical protein
LVALHFYFFAAALGTHDFGRARKHISASHRPRLAPYSNQTSGGHLLNQMVLGLSQNLLKKYIRKNQIRREKNALQSNVPKTPQKVAPYSSQIVPFLCVLFFPFCLLAAGQII